MQSENEYIGDDKFERFLNHYQCPTELETVKLKFAGAICSPNRHLRPTDVISSLFFEDKQPRLATKNEAELFFKFFMGLWDEMFLVVRTNTLKLSGYKKSPENKDDLILFCHNRAKQLEFGFIEGFWGGCQSLNIPAFVAELISSLSDMADIYETLTHKLENNESPQTILSVVKNTDAMVEKTIHFLIEHQVLPNISKLERTVN